MADNVLREESVPGSLTEHGILRNVRLGLMESIQTSSGAFGDSGSHTGWCWVCAGTMSGSGEVRQVL